ncbi:riboflavin kinase [Harmonia axyridis]|uniref:riboflavin kinase n=1 Tax=Harmonia axyridis TaxID=115357 RepID=UPI001E277926|nr:riboflavin kinase [Harmonia axyridis]
MKKFLPHYSSGIVVKGFGRGSKELGIPTANFPEEVVNNLPQDMETGVYYGFSQVDNGPVYKMVMSIGWNPYYKNEKKSMETHILHKFDEDFYGKILKVVILDYIRPELNFNSLDELIDTIKSDIAIAEKNLNQSEFKSFQEHQFFS